MSKLIFLTGYDGFFGQTRKPWLSMDTGRIIKLLEASGIDCIRSSIDTLANRDQLPENGFVFYTFSQRDNMRRLLTDLIQDLQLRGNLLIPALDLLHCHENKGYQVLYAKRHSIDTLKSYYLSSKRELTNLDACYPLVLKTLTGSNGKGVFLVNSPVQALRQITRLEPALSIGKKLDILRRKLFRSTKSFPFYPQLTGKADTAFYRDYITPELPFVLQEFIPGLEYDYRVIILGKRYYVTKRLNRDKDFRASGAKRFIFDAEVPASLLDYARSVYARLHTPFLSLDIGVKQDKHYLFEFQALHFGINAIVRAQGFYQPGSSGWNFIPDKIPIEDSIASGLAAYLTEHGF